MERHPEGFCPRIYEYDRERRPCQDVTQSVIRSVPNSAFPVSSGPGIFVRLHAARLALFGRNRGLWNVTYASAVSNYVRPHIEVREFRDASGAVVEYGNRWADRGGSPPEDSYSVESNLERFAPLHTVAEALIEHLVTTYDVTLTEGPEVVAGLREPIPPEQAVVRAVRLEPARGGAAPLTLLLTAYPLVRVEAGVLGSFVYPSCGCDACDETWESAASEMEWQVFAIVGGGYTETIGKPHRPRIRFERGMGLVRGMGQTVSTRLEAVDGSQMIGGESRAQDIPAEQLVEAQERLTSLAAASVDGNWLPWSRRPA